MVSRIRWALMDWIPAKKAERTQGSARDHPGPSRLPDGGPTEEAIEEDRAGGADRQVIPVRGAFDRRKKARYGGNQVIGEAPPRPEQEQERRGIECGFCA